MLLAHALTERVIGLAIEAQPATRPGILESVFAGCLCHELAPAGIAFDRQTAIPVTDKGIQFDEAFRADSLVDRQPIVEIKAVAGIGPAHAAQVLIYLRMSGLRLGLLFNFHARLLNELRCTGDAEPVPWSGWAWVAAGTAIGHYAPGSATCARMQARQRSCSHPPRSNISHMAISSAVSGPPAALCR